MDIAEMYVPGFEILTKGVKKDDIILVSGGCGTGKTTFVLQSLYNAAKCGEKCMFLTLEEPVERIISNCEAFGWEIRELIKRKKLLIEFIDPYDLSRELEAALLKRKGKLYVKTKGIIGLITKNFKPDRIAIDSLASLQSAFGDKEVNYRYYLALLIRHLREMGLLTLLITEQEQELEKYSRSGIEEFVVDGVFVFYHVRKGSSRQRAIEIKKLRGAEHLSRIVPLEITSKGVVVMAKERIFE